MTNKRVLIVADVPGWCYARRAESLVKYAPEGWDATCCVWANFMAMINTTAEPPDVIFLLDYTQAESARVIMGQLWLDCPLIVSWNRGAGERLDLLQNAAHFADAILFNNRQAYDWAQEHGFRNVAYVCNGVDLSVFRVKVPFERRPNRVLWTGSDAPHKWKGWDDILVPLADKLREMGYEPDFRPLRDSRDARVMSQSEMVDWYNTGKVILCASKSEGTPNTTLEGMACGCVPVSTRTGNIVDIGTNHRDCVFARRDVDAFVGCVFEAIENYEIMAPQAVKTIERLGYGPPARHAKRFYEVFESVLANNKNER